MSKIMQYILDQDIDLEELNGNTLEPELENDGCDGLWQTIQKQSEELDELLNSPAPF